MESKFNIQEYIESGILEQYALGLTSPEENMQIAQYLNQYPELQTELIQIESALEKYARQYDKPMPQALKNKILDTIQSKNPSQYPTKQNTKSIQSNLLQWAAMTALASGLIYFWKQNSDKENSFDAVVQKINILQVQRQNDSIALIDCQKNLLYLKDQSKNRILLKGTPNHKDNIAIIYYDSIARRASMDIVNLPQPPANKQYQLWAIKSGKPVDMGVFVLDQNLQKDIPFIETAEAFAITLEPMGGVSSPTMDQMVVIGQF